MVSANISASSMPYSACDVGHYAASDACCSDLCDSWISCYVEDLNEAFNVVTCSNDVAPPANDDDKNPGIYMPDMGSMISISLGAWIATVVVIVLLWVCAFAVCYYCIQLLEKKEAGLPIEQRTMNTTAKAVMFSATLCMGCMGLAGAYFLYNNLIEQAWQRNAMQNHAVVAVTPVGEKI